MNLNLELDSLIFRLDTEVFTGYYCESCDGLNPLTRLVCPICNTRHSHTDELINAEIISPNLFEPHKGFNNPGLDKQMDDKQALFRNYYNTRRQAITNLSDEDLEKLVIEMQQVAFEAKAYSIADADEVKERKAKKLRDTKSLLTESDKSFNTSDAIGAVVERRKRKSREEKNNAALVNLLGVEGANDILGKIGNKISNPNSVPVQKRVKENVTSELCRIDRHPECVGSFRECDKGESKKCQCKCHHTAVNLDELFG